MSKPSLQQLRAELNRKADNANKYLKGLEADDNYTEAYHKAYMFFSDENRSSNRFKRSVTRASHGDTSLERETIQQELKQINRFLNSATKSTRGLEKAVSNRIAGMEEAIGQGKFSNKQLNTLYAVFNSDSFARASEAAGDSDPIGELVGKAIKDGTRNKRGEFSKLQYDEISKTLDYWASAGGGDVKLLERYLSEFYDIKK